MIASELAAAFDDARSNGQQLLLNHYTDGAHLPTILVVREVLEGKYDRFGDPDEEEEDRVLVQFENWQGDPAIFYPDEDAEVLFAKSGYRQGYLEGYEDATRDTQSKKG